MSVQIGPVAAVIRDDALPALLTDRAMAARYAWHFRLKIQPSLTVGGLCPEDERIRPDTVRVVAKQDVRRPSALGSRVDGLYIHRRLVPWQMPEQCQTTTASVLRAALPQAARRRAGPQEEYLAADPVS